MTPDERHAMTIAVAQAWVDQQAAQYERMGLTATQLHQVKDHALDRFNQWLTTTRGDHAS